MYALEITLQLAFLVGPYLLCAAAGAYLEAKYGATAKAKLLAAEARIKALEEKL